MAGFSQRLFQKLKLRFASVGDSPGTGIASGCDQTALPCEKICFELTNWGVL